MRDEWVTCGVLMSCDRWMTCDEWVTRGESDEWGVCDEWVTRIHFDEYGILEIYEHIYIWVVPLGGPTFLVFF